MNVYSVSFVLMASSMYVQTISVCYVSLSFLTVASAFATTSTDTTISMVWLYLLIVVTASVIHVVNEYYL